MQKMNYEKAVERLEEIVDKLENGNLPLEDMMKLYEEGTVLAANAQKVLMRLSLKLPSSRQGRAMNND